MSKRIVFLAAFILCMFVASVGITGPHVEPNGEMIAMGPLVDPSGAPAMGPAAEPSGVFMVPAAEPGGHTTTMGPAIEPGGAPAMGPAAEPNGGD
jgi:hypothetical protein